jgi:sec-independent protein translocase protein TatC
MLIRYHFKEVKYRLFYLTLSFLLTYLINFNNLDNLILLITPNIESFLLFTNILDSIILKWLLAFYFSLFQLFPYLLFSLWSFIRPGLFKNEDLSFYFIFFIWLSPTLFYLGFLTFYNEVLLNLAYNNSLFRFVPSLAQITLLIKNLIILSVILPIIILIIKIKFNLILKKYIEFRPYILFVIIFIVSFILPPDLFIFLICTLFIFSIIEILILAFHFFIAFKIMVTFYSKNQIPLPPQ